jgi:VWFA-related protein
LVLCASLLVAQQPPVAAPAAAQPDVVFSVTTTLVQVDAVVTDAKGRYVTDLTRDDFAIYEDGKPQPITNVSYIKVSPEAPAGPKPEQKRKPSQPPAPVIAAPTRREDVRRTIVLMVDDLGLSFESMAYVRAALRKFVERQMQPGDLVAVCRAGAGSGALEQFSTDKRMLLPVIDGLRWNPNGRMGVNLFESYGKYSQLAERKAGAGILARGGGAGWPTAASYDVGRNAVFTYGTLGAVNYFVGALRSMPGRKSIVLFSDGIDLSQGNNVLMEMLRKLVDLADRAGTVIYTMHTAGPQTLQPDASDNIDLTGMGQADVRAALRTATEVGARRGRDAAFNAGQQGLAHLALETGGIPFENGNDFNWGLARVLEDQQGYYLIGFKPPSDTFEVKHGTRTYHHVTVKVTRPALRVRSRSGFFGETDEQTLPKYATPLEQMRAAMLSPFRSSDVRLRLTALYAEVPKGGTVVRNLLHIDARDLTFRPDRGRNLAINAPSGSSAEVEIVAVAMSMGDLPVASVARFYKCHAPADRFQEAIEEGALYTLDVPVEKRGAYQIQVAVRDTATGRVGSASQFHEIPELKKGRVALTSIVLRNGESPAGEQAWTGMSPATRQFRAGSEVEYLCLIENPGKKAMAADLDSQIRIVRDGQDVYAGAATLVSTDGGGLAVTGRLKLSAKMTPGDYYLGITAADRTAHNNSVAAQWTDFEIMP